jgi:alpha-amylase
MPCVFWDHYMNPDLQKKIDALSQIRTRAGITAASNVDIRRAEDDFYVAVIDDK